MKRFILATLFPIMSLGLCACSLIYPPFFSAKEEKGEAKLEKRVFRRPSMKIDLTSFSQAPLCPCGNPECKGH